MIHAFNKVCTEPLLRTVKPIEDEYSEARRLQAFLDNFTLIPAQTVYRDSTLRDRLGSGPPSSKRSLPPSWRTRVR